MADESGLLFALTRPVDLSVLESPLPDLFLGLDGSAIITANQWYEKRRPEIIRLFSNEVYGQMPGRPDAMRFEVFDTDNHALSGKATRKQVAVYFTGKHDGARMDLLIYLPNQVHHPVPVIFGLNFWGNHAVINDPQIRLTSSYIEHPARPNGYVDTSGVVNNHATDATRGTDAARWPIETILSHGYGVVTAYRGDLDPDQADGFSQSVRALYPELQNRPDNFSTIGAWAWGMQRAMDYLETDKDIDSKHIAAFGWSRLGKAALWAAATDERFAMMISSESGSGGAKIFRNNTGENIARLNTSFPHWYCQNFRKYNGLEKTLPFDQHMVLALIAPRPLYVASAEPTAIFDPTGEFLGLKGAEPAYILLGKSGLPANTLPPANQSSQGQLGYHQRTGKHDVTAYDWQEYILFMDRHFGNGVISK